MLKGKHHKTDGQGNTALNKNNKKDISKNRGIKSNKMANGNLSPVVLVTNYTDENGIKFNRCFQP